MHTNKNIGNFIHVHMKLSQQHHLRCLVLQVTLVTFSNTAACRMLVDDIGILFGRGTCVRTEML
jgi:hypothetical protein